ncbi:MAG TPA: hypothetical protein VLK37_12400 [Solirubrobacterales bacterium]|nr:hypothetical protein [Solirubrobacterales bacterium]
MGWPPKVGELLPRAEEATGVREKLASYSLNTDHHSGGPKARGFAVILGITMDSINYLEAEMRLAITRYPITAAVDNQPYGWKCVVDFPLEGIGRYSGRVAKVRTVWELTSPILPPRLVNAFLKV